MTTNGINHSNLNSVPEKSIQWANYNSINMFIRPVLISTNLYAHSWIQERRKEEREREVEEDEASKTKSSCVFTCSTLTIQPLKKL